MADNHVGAKGNTSSSGADTTVPPTTTCAEPAPWLRGNRPSIRT
ncbi:hypothetical protein N599_07435 [Saccharopolyspora erythraea D]|nr:hypothetical protein N599_07435 [Saccharopolyspora erythraea D]